MGVCSMVHGMWSMVMHPLMGILNTYDGILMDTVSKICLVSLVMEEDL